jgi:hypothetical protein
VDVKIPDEIQCYVDIPSYRAGQPYRYKLCFTHAIRAAVAGLTVHMELTDEFPTCAKCTPHAEDAPTFLPEF